jgi:serine protease AprX
VPGDAEQRYFRGSGTSQATAVVSGAAALLLQQRPNLTPDQVKALLMGTATPMPLADPIGRGAGELNVAAAATRGDPVATQLYPASTGTGSIEQCARHGPRRRPGHRDGTDRRDGHHGPAWKAATWAAASTAGTAWTGGTWNGRVWAVRRGPALVGGPHVERRGVDGCNWTGRTWSGRTWSSAVWTGRTWSGRTWSGRTWSGAILGLTVRCRRRPPASGSARGHLGSDR